VRTKHCVDGPQLIILYLQNACDSIGCQNCPCTRACTDPKRISIYTYNLVATALITFCETNQN